MTKNNSKKDSKMEQKIYTIDEIKNEIKNYDRIDYLEELAQTKINNIKNSETALNRFTCINLHFLENYLYHYKEVKEMISKYKFEDDEFNHLLFIEVNSQIDKLVKGAKVESFKFKVEDFVDNIDDLDLDGKVIERIKKLKSLTCRGEIKNAYRRGRKSVLENMRENIDQELEKDVDGEA